MDEQSDKTCTQYVPERSAITSTSDIVATTRTTAKHTTLGPQWINETNDNRVEYIREATTTTVSDRVAAMKGAIPRLGTII